MYNCFSISLRTSQKIPDTSLSPCIIVKKGEKKGTQLEESHIVDSMQRKITRNDATQKKATKENLSKTPKKIKKKGKRDERNGRNINYDFWTGQSGRFALLHFIFYYKADFQFSIFSKG